MAFHVGQKVVCVNDGWRLVAGPKAIAEVRKGDVLTVHSVLERGAKCFLHFREATHGYDANCFRPVVEPKTDISIFTAMLKPKKATEPA